MDTVSIDVMTNNGRTFYKTIKYKYCPLFKFDFDVFFKWITAQLPSLRTRTDAVLFLSFPNGEQLECKLKN